jgi:hypothetical protein
MKSDQTFLWIDTPPILLAVWKKPTGRFSESGNFRQFVALSRIQRRLGKVWRRA